MVTVFAARFHELGYLDYPLPLTYDERFTKAVHRFQSYLNYLGFGPRSFF